MTGLISTVAISLALAAGANIPAAARKTIADTNAAWLQAMKRHDAAAIAAIYGDDAVFVTAAGDMLRGRAAIEQFEQKRFETTGRVVDGAIADDGFARAGALVYEWGHATLRVARDDGTSTVVTGRFLTVWAKDSSGRWHITRNLSLP